MGMVDWYVEGVEFGNCNCDYGCPCQFRIPTDPRPLPRLRGRADRQGTFRRRVRWTARAALLYAWPGPIFEGNGEMQAIIDERADAAQRHALATILHGGETRDGGDPLVGVHAMSSTVHEPIFKPIEFEVDIEQRRARVVIPGVLESSGRPIRSPATGDEHRVRIDIPNGIEFELAEIGSATTKASGRSRSIWTTPTASSACCAIRAPAWSAHAPDQRRWTGRRTAAPRRTLPEPGTSSLSRPCLSRGLAPASEGEHGRAHRLPTVADVEAAAVRLRGIAVRTPLLEIEALNERAGGRVLLKAECLQRTGSFKFRGAYNTTSSRSKRPRWSPIRPAITPRAWPRRRSSWTSARPS